MKSLSLVTGTTQKSTCFTQAVLSTKVDADHIPPPQVAVPAEVSSFTLPLHYNLSGLHLQAGRKSFVAGRSGKAGPPAWLMLRRSPEKTDVQDYIGNA